LVVLKNLNENMKSFKEFLLETQTTTDIEQLTDICKKIVDYISEKIGLQFGIIQQAFFVVKDSMPHICFDSRIVLNSIPENDEFLLGEIKDTFLKLAEEYKISTRIITQDESTSNADKETAFNNNATLINKTQ
jgi:hypothetical protein